MRFTNLFKRAGSYFIVIDPKKRYIGIIFTLVAWFMLAFSTILFQKIEGYAFDGDVSITFFFQFLASTTLYFLLCIPKGIRFFKVERATPFFVRCGCGIAAYFLYSSAKIWTQNVDNAILMSTEALFVPVLLWMFLKRKFSTRTWIGVGTGFCGVLLLHSFNSSAHGIVTLVGLTAGFTTAVIIIITSYVIKTNPPLRVAFYQCFLGMLIALSWAIFHWEWPNANQLSAMLYSGLFYGLALFLFVDALFYTEVYIVATLGYSLVFFSEITHWVLHESIPTQGTLYSFVLILIGGLIVIASSYKQDKKLLSSKSKD